MFETSVNRTERSPSIHRGSSGTSRSWVRGASAVKVLCCRANSAWSACFSSCSAERYPSFEHCQLAVEPRWRGHWYETARLQWWLRLGSSHLGYVKSYQLKAPWLQRKGLGAAFTVEPRWRGHRKEQLPESRLEVFFSSVFSRVADRTTCCTAASLLLAGWKL